MSTMPIKDNTYASLLSGNKIRYVPSCLVLQMILKFSSRLSMMNAGGGLETLCPDLTAFVRQLTVNILHTANAYKNRGSMLFPGDWKSDCPRIRKVFHDILARVGYVGEIFGQQDREKLQEDVRRAAAAWNTLDGIMEEKANRDRSLPPAARTTPHFRNEHRVLWKQTMARILLEMTDAKPLEPDERLIIVCHRRVKIGLTNELEALERSRPPEKRIGPDRILCVHNDDLPVTCHNCTQMTGGERGHTRTSVRRCYLRRRQDAAADRNRPSARLDSRQLTGR